LSYNNKYTNQQNNTRNVILEKLLITNLRMRLRDEKRVKRNGVNMHSVAKLRHERKEDS